MKVAVAIYDQDTQRVLCGLESYYCFEENTENKKQLYDLEYCNEEQAIERAIMLSTHFNREIHYTQFYQQRTHFSCLTTNSHWGIVKGNGYQGEDAITALQREIQEEVGIILHPARFHQINMTLKIPTTMFLCPVTTNEVTHIREYLKERDKRHCGELFHLAFRDLTLMEHMNYITRKICQWITKHNVYSVTHTYPIEYSPLLDVIPHVQEYTAALVIEPPFVWGAKRQSLLPLPKVVE